MCVREREIERERKIERESERDKKKDKTRYFTSTTFDGSMSANF